MKEVILSLEAGPEEAALNREVKRLQGLKAKVYRTTVHSPIEKRWGWPKPEHFITTSKDLHLELGQMSVWAQWELACLIHREIDHAGGTVLIFESEEKHGAILASVVLNKVDNDLHIHLSSAR